MFLINAALGTDLVTSYVAATDDKPPKPTGCFTALLAVFAGPAGLVGNQQDSGGSGPGG